MVVQLVVTIASAWTDEAASISFSTEGGMARVVLYLVGLH
jgi:hypothetical protein